MAMVTSSVRLAALYIERVCQMIYGWQDEMEQLAEFHALLSVFKAVYSWTAQTAIQQCRESCGGHGYLKCEFHSTHQLYKLSNTLFILSLLNLLRIADRSAGASQRGGNIDF